MGAQTRSLHIIEFLSTRNNNSCSGWNGDMTMHSKGLSTLYEFHHMGRSSGGPGHTHTLGYHVTLHYSGIGRTLLRLVLSIVTSRFQRKQELWLCLTEISRLYAGSLDFVLWTISYMPTILMSVLKHYYVNTSVIQAEVWLHIHLQNLSKLS